MKPAATPEAQEKKAHVCPPSNATHPRDRWESLFVYGFICKFTQLKGKVEGLETPMDFEDALLSPEANPTMTQILSRFVLNLRSQTRNLSSDVISSTISSLFQEYFKNNERTVFWSDEYRANIDPFQGENANFWAASWDFKLKVLRQLVEFQLCHCQDIKLRIDRAWGVIHNKHKKMETTSAPPPPEDPNSMENLQLVPLGQDHQRKRYWFIDASPRVYMSTNPWKITATFQALTSTREEYMNLIEQLKAAVPAEGKPGERRPKVEVGHLALVKALEDRVPAIDAELLRIQRLRKKIQQRHMLIAQAEFRETRTRRKATRVDYAYLNDPEDEDDGDEYVYNDDHDQADEYEFMQEGSSNGRRRSTRTTRSNGNSAAAIDEWRGERRSSRLGATTDMRLDEPPPPKRARTADSTSSGDFQPSAASSTADNGRSLRISGAAAIKPTETAVEAIAGKKKSKFWFYAVEPIPGQAAAAPVPSASTSALPDVDMADAHHSGAGSASVTDDGDTELPPPSESNTNGDLTGRSVSPSNMDES
ncbi:hypothetical protein BXZ70DRAFT_293547 [Cristinia sonorae]|uniref:WHIM1 domain-containing protein n=1 Tax=Cristinia sonorae TaxID=1940300 RepID=A0A8K0UND4_9AGAR|nr:hypothetical protein BXZ70DRAFT_293547 [Cristinia sonorae]